MNSFRLQRKRTVLALAAALCVMLCGFAAAFLFLARPFAETKSYTSESPASVKEVIARRDSQTGALLYYPVYELMADGVKLTLHSIAGYPFSPWQTGDIVMLSYNPADPAQFLPSEEMGLPLKQLGAGLASIAVSLVSFAVFVYLLFAALQQKDSRDRAVYDLSDLGEDKSPVKSVQDAGDSMSLSSVSETGQDLPSDDKNLPGTGSKTEGIQNEKLRQELLYQDEYVEEAVRAALRLFADNTKWTEGFMTTTGKSSIFVPFKQGLAGGGVYTSVGFDGGRTLYVDIFPRNDKDEAAAVSGFGVYQLRYAKLVQKILADMDRGESISLGEGYALSVDLSS